MPYKYVVSIDESALTGIILTGLESFLLPNLNVRNRKQPEQAIGHEIDGYVFGTRKKQSRNVLKFEINFISINTTSKTEQASVQPGTDTYALKTLVHKAIYPRAKFLGDFHTHPYRLRIDKKKMLSTHFSPDMYQPSPDDENFGAMEECQLDLILAIVNARRKLNHASDYAKVCKSDAKCYMDCVSDSEDDRKYCIQFDIGIFRFFLAAYVRQGKETNFSYAPFCSTKFIIPDLLKRRCPRSLDFSKLSHLLENLSKTPD